MENMNLSNESKDSGALKKIKDDLMAEVVNEYLRKGYADGGKEHDISVSGTTYKVLDRGEVTTFYDAAGDTLLKVDNKELAAQYEGMENSVDMPAPVEEQGNDAGVTEGENPDPAEMRENSDGGTVPDMTEKMEEDFKEKARGKLHDELKNADDKQFADPIIEYLLKRCSEDNGLAQDVMQEHKTWKKCMNYIFDRARKQAKGNRAAVRDDVVYEWAEDYYHKDDKAEEEKKAKEAAERKKKEDERREKCAKAAEKKKADKKNVKQGVKKEDKAEGNPADLQNSKKNPKEIDGQMDLFSMMGM